MFNRHRQDLKEAQEQTIKAMRDTILIQADMIDYLRSKADGHAFVSTRTPALNPSQMVPAEMDGPKWLTEEEEEILALNLQGRISDHELQKLQADLGLSGLSAAPDFTDD